MSVYILCVGRCLGRSQTVVIGKYALISLITLCKPSWDIFGQSCMERLK